MPPSPQPHRRDRRKTDIVIGIALPVQFLSLYNIRQTGSATWEADLMAIHDQGDIAPIIAPYEIPAFNQPHAGSMMVGGVGIWSLSSNVQTVGPNSLKWTFNSLPGAPTRFYIPLNCGTTDGAIPADVGQRFVTLP